MVAVLSLALMVAVLSWMLAVLAFFSSAWSASAWAWASLFTLMVCFMSPMILSKIAMMTSPLASPFWGAAGCWMKEPANLAARICLAFSMMGKASTCSLMAALRSAVPSLWSE